MIRPTPPFTVSALWPLATGHWPLASVLWLLCSCQAERQGARKSAGRDYTNRICRLAGDDAIITAAVYGFVGRAEPRVGRFVYIPGTDSTPPPAGIQALQDRGPTYLYSADSALRAPVERQLEAVGDYPTLLVAYHGLTKADALHPAVKLSGHYVTGTGVVGKSLGVKTISPQCDSSGSWVAPGAAGESGAG